jgi:hypothetical protein
MIVKKVKIYDKPVEGEDVHKWWSVAVYYLFGVIPIWKITTYPPIGCVPRYSC